MTTNYVDGVYDPASSDDDLSRVTTYDVAGRASRMQNADGRITAYEYDAQGRQVDVLQNYQDGNYDLSQPDRDLRPETVYDDATRRVRARLAVSVSTRLRLR